jgi:hypothetical protein
MYGIRLFNRYRVNCCAANDSQAYFDAVSCKAACAVCDIPTHMPHHGLCDPCCRCTAADFSFNKAWLASHLEACKTQLGNKPLVLQEYNMPQCPQRTAYYNHVSFLCHIALQLHLTYPRDHTACVVACMLPAVLLCFPIWSAVRSHDPESCVLPTHAQPPGGTGPVVARCILLLSDLGVCHAGEGHSGSKQFAGWCHELDDGCGGILQ